MTAIGNTTTTTPVPPRRGPRAAGPARAPPSGTGPAGEATQAAGSGGDGPRCGSSVSGPALAGSRRVHDRVRQRIRAAARPPDDRGPGGPVRPRPVAGVAGHVGELPPVPARRRDAAARPGGPGPAP